jgi:HAD superfamily 5'-nucleotidase-like hydrolase
MMSLLTDHASAVLGLLLFVHTINASCAFVMVPAFSFFSSSSSGSFSRLCPCRRVHAFSPTTAAATASDNQNDNDNKRLQTPIKLNGSTEPVIVANGENNVKERESVASSASPRGMFISSCKETLDESFLTLPRHSRMDGVNGILEKTESVIRALHLHSMKKNQNDSSSSSSRQKQRQAKINVAKQAGRRHETVYANNYIDLGKVDTVGFDFDYTLVSYTEDLLELIYDMALQRLVADRQYPAEMLEIGLRFDPNFSIRGLAVDTKTGWICHLAYTHKVAVAWEGRERVPTPRIYAEYRGKRGMTPSERRKRLKPLNDLFSMSECCLIADTVQFFKDRNIPYNGQNVITDVLSAIGTTHISGDFHRLVANNPAKYFEPTPHLKQVVRNLKDAGKRLIFVSNSPFWYVDAGMKYIFGDDWTKDWNAIIASAGKPTFYTEETRPFREVDIATARPMFKPVERFERGRVYTEGCLKELTRLMDWSRPSISQNVNVDEDEDEDEDAKFGITSGAVDVAAANVLYIGDSLFADLVDAKREFSWTSKSILQFAFRITSIFCLLRTKIFSISHNSRQCLICSLLH